MSKINVYVMKDGVMKYSYIHWRHLHSLFQANFENFEGLPKEFLFVNIDDKTILNSSFFTLMDLPFAVSKNIAKEYDYEEL